MMYNERYKNDERLIIMQKEKKEVTPNPEQEKCIKSDSDKLLVIAGPGTGKTYTVVEKVKHLISKEGVKSDRILCLTFSDAGATEMRNRIRKELNNQALKVNVYTFHGFCNELITEEPGAFGIAENFRVITNAMETKLLKESITAVNPESFRGPKNNPLNFNAFSTIKKMIKKFKRFNITTREQFNYNKRYHQDWEPEYNRLLDAKRMKEESGQKILKRDTDPITRMEKIFKKADDAWDVYMHYQQNMGIYIDYDDMINRVLDRFKEDSVYLYEVSSRYDYIIVDEYQDTNPNQNELLFRLTDKKDDGKLFVVCDDDQIIYGFQGARINTIDKFIEKYSPEQICLIENRRSTQDILIAAYKVASMQNKKYRLDGRNGIDKKLTSFKGKGKPARCYVYADVLQENNEIAEEIKKLTESDELPLNDKNEKNFAEIAILARTHEELYAIAEVLKGKNIKYELKEGKNIFNIKASQLLYNYMQFLTNPDFYADKFFKMLLSYPFHVESKDYQTLCLKKYQYDCLLKDNEKIDAENFMDYVITNSAEGEYIKWDKIHKIFTTYTHLQKYKSVETLKNVIVEIGNKTGLFKHYIETDENKLDNIAGFQKLVDEAIDFSDSQKKINLEDFVEYLELCESDDSLAIKTDESPFTKNAVQLLTYHGSKGKEFDYVYMPNLIEKNWEGKKVNKTPDVPIPPEEYKTEEELKDVAFAEHAKLFYVGMTRARHILRLSYSTGISENDKQEPTVFLSGIYDLCEHQDEPFQYKGEEFYRSEQAKTLTKTEDYDYNAEFCSMVDAVLEKAKFSPKALNMYNDCPRKYMYEYILKLASNGEISNAANFGIIIHTTCQYAVDEAKKREEHITKEEFLKKFYEEMRNPETPFTDADEYKKHKERGEKILSEYYVQLTNTKYNEFFATEKKVEYTDDDGITFTGYIDRIDKTKNGYIICDYKTGSAKNESKICAGGENEHYYNQIALYKYILEHSETEDGKKFNVIETKFIFPEECTKNYSPSIDETECLRVVNKYKSMISDMKQYKFDPNPRLQEKTCEYCPHKDKCPRWYEGKFVPEFAKKEIASG